MMEIDDLNWNLPSRYSLIRLIGKGSFSSVCVAVDRSNPDQKVAIKNLQNIYQNVQEARRLLREICIMIRLDHPNIVHFRDLIIPSVNQEDFNEIYLVMDCSNTDLKQLLMSNMYLDNSQVKFILYQAICAVRYLHSANILHRDLKPANILINEDCSIRICDFGLSRSFRLLSEDMQQQAEIVNRTHLSPDQVTGVRMRTIDRDARKAARILTKHVITRQYRAPEVILMEQEYDKAVDVWSLGCIFAELLGMIESNRPDFRTRGPLFPGTSCFPLSPDMDMVQRGFAFPISDNDQIKKIFDILGSPSQEDLAFLSDKMASMYIRLFPHIEPVPFEQLFQGSTQQEIEILSMMLKFNPSKRATLDQLIQHPYFDGVRQPEREIIETEPIELYWDFDNNITIEDLRNVFRREIATQFDNYEEIFD